MSNNFYENRANAAKRLLWSGEVDQIYNNLNEHSLIGELEPSSRTETFNKCLQTFLNAQNILKEERNNRMVLPNYPQPFEEILIPFVYYAREELKAKVGKVYDLLSEDAHFQLEHNLFLLLSRLNAISMQSEFIIFRTIHEPRLPKLFKTKTEKRNNEQYQKFIKYLLEGGLLNYFKEYSVLARLVATAVEFWIEAVSEFINHFESDRVKLQNMFNDDKEIGKIINISPLLSDRHNKGKSVMVATFEAGIKLVYKPKNLGIERVFNELIEGLNFFGSPVQLKTFKVLNYTKYGWTEFVENKPIENEDGAKEHFKRMGALLCLTYILGATDLHYENIIQHGEDPVLIDLETLLHPLIYNASTYLKEDALSTASDLIINSAIRTGLLPRWSIDGKESTYDASGLGKMMRQKFSRDIMRWKEINTDLMHMHKERSTIFINERPTYSKKDNNLNLAHFAAEIVKGFSEMYNFLSNEREQILNSPFWHAFSNQEVRFVFRPTKVYAQIQQNLLQPQLLKSALDRSIHLNILYNSMASNDNPPTWWPLVEEEKAAMEIMDIPRFTINTSSNAIELRTGKKIENYFKEASFNLATERLKGLNKQDLRQQIEFIKGSLSCRSAKCNHAFSIKGKSEESIKTFHFTKEIALQKSIHIASILEEKAIVATDRSITWIAPKYYSEVKRYQLEPISNHIYEGNAGIALFFAALYTQTRENKYKDFAKAALTLPLKHIRETHSSAAMIGGFSGNASLIYCFLTVGKLLEEPYLIDAAKKTASLITLDAINEDRNYDVLYGTAGTILNLLKLYGVTQDNNILATSIYCGNHLLKNRAVTSTGLKAWELTDKLFLTGFSHGVAGIAYALLQLYKVTNNKAFKEAALEAIAFENSFFDNKENNWLDLRVSELRCKKRGLQKSLMCSWCHGAGGIGLARMGTIDIINTEGVRRDIYSAIETTKRYLLGNADHLCCGNFGRLELLLNASLQFSDEELYAFVLNKAGEIVDRSEKKGDFGYASIGFTPGLFQGISGIGYQMLRIAFPEVLPSIALLK